MVPNPSVRWCFLLTATLIVDFRLAARKPKLAFPYRSPALTRVNFYHANWLQS